jgi:hypothetical protein
LETSSQVLGGWENKKKNHIVPSQIMGEDECINI